MSEEATVVDGTVVEEHETSLAVVPVQQVRHEVIMPLDVEEQARAMDLYQAGLRRILDDSDWQGAGREKFVKKSGWRKIATWLNVSIELRREEVERDDHGRPVRARVWARAVAPTGRFMDGDGACSLDEDRFAKASGRKKIENDLLATAATRATNRAISNLVGMGAVSAEEVDEPATPFGPPAPKDRKSAEKFDRALRGLVADDDGVPEAAREVLRRDSGYLPMCVHRAVLWLASLQPVSVVADGDDSDLPWAGEAPEPGGEPEPSSGVGTAAAGGDVDPVASRATHEGAS